MPVDQEQVAAVLDELLSATSMGTSRGQGGGGNPRETWEITRGNAVLAMTLDPDAVFTFARWTCQSLLRLCSQAETKVATLVEASGQLASDEEVIDVTPALYDSVNLLSRSLVQSRVAQTGEALRAPLASAVDAISLVGQELAAVVPPAGTYRTPSEARAVIRAYWADLLSVLAEIEDKLSSLSGLVQSLPAVMPRKQADQLIRSVRSSLGAILDRQQTAVPSARTATAAADLIKVSASISLLERLVTGIRPVLSRGTFVMTATGSGDGALFTGSYSGPFSLKATQSDNINVQVDGGPATGDIPISSPIETAYLLTSSTTATFPTPGGESIILRVDGRAGVPVLVPAAVTPAALAAAVAGTPGAIPENPVGNPFLIVASTGTEVYVAYNLTVPPLPAPATLDLGSYVEIEGPVATMNALGFSGSNADDPTTLTVRSFWCGTSLADVVRVLQEELRAYGVDVHTVVRPPWAGVARFPVASPYVAQLFNYSGSVDWRPDQSRVVLLREGIENVQSGDLVTISSTVTGVVTKIEDGSLVLGSVAGVLAAGVTTAVVAPTSQSIDVGSVLFIVDSIGSPRYRVSNVGLSADGYLNLTLSRRCYLAGMGANVWRRVSVQRELLVLGSRNRGATGSFTLLAPLGGDATAELGLVLGTVNGLVNQLSTTGDLISAGVQAGDVVVGSFGSSTVAEVLEPTRLRLTGSIPGTFNGPVIISNYKYAAFNDLLAGVAAWSPPDVEDAEREIRECTRAAGAVVAGTRLAVWLSQLSAALQALRPYLTAYAGTVPVGATAVAVRKSVEDAGADRAKDLLVSGRVGEALSVALDGAAYDRYLQRQMRQLGRKVLGSSVYLQAAEQERLMQLPPERVSLDIEPTPLEDMGPPRSAGR